MQLFFESFDEPDVNRCYLVVASATESTFDQDETRD
jgi:hypothetical protein